MASQKTYLVPVDFSKTSGRALNYAIKLARETGAKLLLVHVITDSPAYIPINLRDRIYSGLEDRAERKLAKLMRDKKAEDLNQRTVIVQDGNPARFVSDQARKSRVSMIVMGSHGRTGVERFILGSVAEKTVRYAQCPVLIVKR